MSDVPPTGDGPDDPFEGLEDLFGAAGPGESGSADEPGAGGGPGGLGGLPVIGDLMRVLQGAAPGSSHAREVARAIASGGSSEPNIDPTDRIALEQLVRVAELRVTDATGLQPSRGAPLRVEVVNRVGWSDRTVGDYGDLVNALGESLSAGADPDSDDAAADPMTAMLAGLSRMLGPAMLSLTTGAMVGRLAQHALGGYVLPVPRPPGKPMLVALPNVKEFGRQWSLDADDLRMWVCLHEAVYHAVFGVDHVREALSDLLMRHASSFEANPRRLEEMLDDFDPISGGPEALARLQQELGSPDALLGAVRSDIQEALLPQMTALVAAITGYVDHTMDRIGAQLIGSYDRLAEALRRHRVEASESDRFVERLLGLELDQEQYDRGTAFAAGVVERAGPEGLRRLFTDPANLPTPAEVDAAGLWLARIDLPR
jgi:putative hydrolase